MTMLPAPRRVRRTGDDTPARSLAVYVWRMSGWHQVALGLLATVVSALALAPIELQRRLIDNAIMPADAEALWRLAGLYLAAVLAFRLAKGVLAVGQGWLAESAVLYTRSHLGRILCAGGSRLGDATPGETVTVLGKEAERLGGYVGEVPSQAIANLALLSGMASYMLYVDPLIAAVGLGLLLPQVLVIPFIQRKLNALNGRHVEQTRIFGDEVNACLPEEDRARRLDTLYAIKVSTHLWKALMKGLIGLENQLAPLGILLFGGLQVIDGQTSLGVVVAFASGFDRLREPTRDLLGLYRRTALTAVQHRMIADWITRGEARTATA